MGRTPQSWSYELDLNTNDVPIREVRRGVIALLRERFAGEAIDLAATEAIVGELLANIYKYAPGRFVVRAGLHAPRTVALELRDEGPAFRFPPPAPTLTEPGGHGLLLAAALARELRVARDDRGNTIEVVLPEES